MPRHPEMEDVDSISVAVAGIDIDTVEPLENKTMVGFINKFICDTASFLNHFAYECERKLQKVQEKIIRMDANLKILEAKLASIPSVVTGGVPSSQPSTCTNSSVPQSSEPKITPVVQEPIKASSESSNVPTPKAETITDPETGAAPPNVTGNLEESSGGGDGERVTGKSHPKDDPEYAKYFKMAAVGVPIPAIKLKMSSEGVDPSVLDFK